MMPLTGESQYKRHTLPHPSSLEKLEILHSGSRKARDKHNSNYNENGEPGKCDYDNSEYETNLSLLSFPGPVAQDACMIIPQSERERKKKSKSPSQLNKGQNVVIKSPSKFEGEETKVSQRENWHWKEDTVSHGNDRQGSQQSELVASPVMDSSTTRHSIYSLNALENSKKGKNLSDEEIEHINTKSAPKINGGLKYEKEKAQLEAKLRAAETARSHYTPTTPKKTSAGPAGMDNRAEMLSIGAGGGISVGGAVEEKGTGGERPSYNMCSRQTPPLRLMVGLDGERDYPVNEISREPRQFQHIQPQTPISPHYQDYPQQSFGQMSTRSSEYEDRQLLNSRGGGRDATLQTGRHLPALGPQSGFAFTGTPVHHHTHHQGPPSRQHHSYHPAGEHKSSIHGGGQESTTSTFNALDPSMWERERQYGTPEMPRGNAVLPHLPVGALTPRPSIATGQVKQLPRGDRLPLTGYELLAAHLANSSRRPNDSSRDRSNHHSNRDPGHQFERRGSTTSAATVSIPPNFGSFDGMAATATSNSRYAGSSYLPPLYKRFTALSHRVLLTLQDELAELEEQLHRLDTNDTQIRRLPGGQILPSSRRQDTNNPSELQWTRTQLLARISDKIASYNNFLSAFQSVQAIPRAPHDEVSAYRAYLAQRSPIAENEARFLDAEWDLVSLRPKSWTPDVNPWNENESDRWGFSAMSGSPGLGLGAASRSSTTIDGQIQPSTEGSGGGSIEAGSGAPHILRHRRSSILSSDIGRKNKTVDFTADTSLPSKYGGLENFKVPTLAAVSALAILFPLFVFIIIPNFLGRMVVVFVAAGIGGGLTRGTILSMVARRRGNEVRPGDRDIIILTGAYIAVMAVVANVVA